MHAPQNQPEVSPVDETPASAEVLRAALIDKLIADERMSCPRVIDAFKTIERHRFLPGVELEKAYANDSVPIKFADNGTVISTISQPAVIAIQLEQLEVQPGHRVLEIGAATGYNAALLSHLAGPQGKVWTVDIDQDLVDAATKHLSDHGIANAQAILGDGAAGLTEHATYDRIIFTVGAGDVPPAVFDQLAPEGRLVLPLRLKGSVSRSIAFEWDSAACLWRSVSSAMATFIPLRGNVCSDTCVSTPFTGDGDLKVETYFEQDLDPKAIARVLDTSAHQVFTSVKFRRRQSWEWLYLWIGCVLPNGISRMPGKREGFKPHFFWGSMATFDRDSLAYLTIHEGTDEQAQFWQVGVIGHGPAGEALANTMAQAIEEWGRERPSSLSFRMAFGVHRTSLQAADPRFVIDKPSCRIVVDWA